MVLMNDMMVSLYREKHRCWAVCPEHLKQCGCSCGSRAWLASVKNLSVFSKEKVGFHPYDSVCDGHHYHDFGTSESCSFQSVCRMCDTSISFGNELYLYYDNTTFGIWCGSDQCIVGYFIFSQ